MAKEKTPFPSKSTRLIFTACLAILTVILFSYLLFLQYYQGRIFPGVKVASYNIGGQTPQSVSSQLTGDFSKRLKTPLSLNFEEQNFTVDLAKAAPEIGVNSIVSQAYSIGRSGDLLQDFINQFRALFFGVELTPGLTYTHPAQLLYQINTINQVIKKEPRNARLILGEGVSIASSLDGQEVDGTLLLSRIESYLNLTDSAPTAVPVRITPPKFSERAAQTAKLALENVKNSPITLKSPEGTAIINQLTLFNILDLSGENQTVAFPGVVSTGTGSASLESINIREAGILIDQGKLASYLSSLLTKINHEARDARFTFDPAAKRVREFQSAREGREVSLDQTAIMIAQAALTGSPREIDLPIKITQPEIRTSEAENFGIKEKVGEGFSRFAGSIENRIFNIGLAASRLNGALVAPGEVFSFNKTVGDISGATGYKQAYIIKDGRTVLDDGGGVCQVSTTLFRAILNAGLPIVSRTAHAYRVSYYEQGFPPGLDATVFSPSVDLKFRNDTQNYLLIQTSQSGTNLTVEIYGTSDGRVSSLSTPVVANQTPPPPELRQDDPTLPRGTIKQVDWPAWGANVSFGRTVTRNGETLISETFKSNYRPWQAIFLVGTKD